MYRGPYKHASAARKVLGYWLEPGRAHAPELECGSERLVVQIYPFIRLAVDVLERNRAKFGRTAGNF